MLPGIVNLQLFVQVYVVELIISTMQQNILAKKNGSKKSRFFTTNNLTSSAQGI